MNEKQLTLIYNYILRQQTTYEHEVQQLQQNIRYRSIDVIDCVELLCASERLNTFKETTKNIVTLLRFDKATQKALEKLEKQHEK